VQAMRARFQLPTGLIVHPMAEPQDLPVIGLDAGGIVRCRRCRTYINPFVTWTDGGRCVHITLRAPYRYTSTSAVPSVA
jgi:protein transport protein SEC24